MVFPKEASNNNPHPVITVKKQFLAKYKLNSGLQTSLKTQIYLKPHLWSEFVKFDFHKSCLNSSEVCLSLMGE